MKPTQFRHGDLLFVQVDTIPSNACVVPCTDGKGGQIAAYGEVTTHAHRVYGAERLTVEANGVVEQYFAARDGAYVDHEEHGVILLPTGAYQVIRQRQYAPEANRWVAD